jgi:predicted ribosomally synthesized peptide with SipW-like signal peptide
MSDNHMIRRRGRRRWPLLALLAVAAAGTGVGTVALFTDVEVPGANSFESGTVELGLGSATSTCTVPVLVPGDSSTGWGSGSADRPTCRIELTYTGSAAAWLGVDVLVDGASSNLFTGGSDGIQFTVRTDGGTSILTGTTYRDPSGVPRTVQVGTSVDGILLAGVPAVAGDALVVELDYLLPTAAPNALQGRGATVSLTFRAAQASNQPILGCVAGRQCGTITWG